MEMSPAGPTSTPRQFVPPSTGLQGDDDDEASMATLSSSPNKSYAPLLMRNREPLRDIPLWLANSRAVLLSHGAEQETMRGDCGGASTARGCRKDVPIRSHSISPLVKKQRLFRRRSSATTAPGSRPASGDCPSSPLSVTIATSADVSAGSMSNATPASLSLERRELGGYLRWLGQRTAHALQVLPSRALYSWRPSSTDTGKSNFAAAQSRVSQPNASTESLYVPHSLALYPRVAPSGIAPRSAGVLTGTKKRKRSRSSVMSTGSDSVWSPYDEDADKENRCIF